MEKLSKIYKYEAQKKIKILIIFIILILVSYVSTFSGIADISLKRVFVTYFKFNISQVEALSKREMIIFTDLRFARVFLGIIAGFSLAVCGTIMQSITQNKMSSPFTTGISSAASMGAALAILFFLEKFKYSEYIIVLFAFIFGLLCSLLVYGLSMIKGMTKGTLILIGIAFNYLFSSGNAALQFVANDEVLSSIVNWTFGNFSGLSWTKIFIMTMILLLLFPYFFINRHSYNLLAMGEESAISLGVNVKRLRIVSGIIITLLTASVVSFVGVIAFVGIIAPHIARMLMGDDHRYSIILSGLIGSVLLVVADYIGRTIISPIIVPIGIVVSFVGIPIFIYLIMSSKRV
ncbi:MAG: iron ABC transporter permease [Fusobacterium sp.]|uniref:FecCD family ABC transporter permease n=1 Tax=Fusobacterium sp. TaxID=68766 RepID=UPI0026DBCCA0|nr:iron ABC transporter permease [Fusobacterium sp.]MDO4689918.1 iron ABC transporter permease [Fusobacterium sp.]